MSIPSAAFTTCSPRGLITIITHCLISFILLLISPTLSTSQINSHDTIDSITTTSLSRSLQSSSSLTNLLVVSSSSADQQQQFTLSKLKFPQHECLGLPPVNQYYFPKMYTFNTPFVDYCKVEESTASNIDCVNTLCSGSRVWDLTNGTQRDELDFTMNYCLYCGGYQPSLFRSSIQTCTNLNVINYTTLMSMLNTHCNGQSDTVKSISIFDSTFLTTDYFK